MNQKIVARNAMVAVGQVIVTSVVLFMLYRYLIKTIGVERLGIWSVVMAAASALRIGEMGLSGSATKYVAKYYALNQPKKAAMVVQTAALSLAVIVALFLAILYPLLHWGFAFIFPVNSLEEARILLPFALFYLWLITISGVFQSGLDGCLRTDLRGLLVIGGNFLLLGLALVMVPRFGLIGLVYAQLFQAFAMALIGWAFLRYAIKDLPIVLRQWSYGSFKEILGYSANLQLINICVMLFEPVTKMFLAKFGGLSMAGYYEMAQRLVSQIRAVLLAANKILVPVIARLHETDPKRIQDIYKDDYRMLLYLALPAYMGIVALSPVISELWIGRYTEIFVLFLMVLSSAAFLHILTGPAYFMNLGTGHLKWNVAAHVMMSAGNLLLAFFLGSWCWYRRKV
jgi:O-antigen/teichoic acid export membrane protein